MLETLVKGIIPLNDIERLEVLNKYNILYTPAEKTFDNITQMMAEVFNTPMAFISLIDRDQVFYKSQFGPFGRNQIERVDSLCSLTILGSEPLVIEDASAETCFADNPYITAKGGIRFYAGAPLITKEGLRIGTACIVDTSPRNFPEEKKALLARFADLVMHEIEVRQASFKQIETQEELNKAQLQLQSALEVGKITPWSWDIITNKVYGNAALATMFGVDVEKAKTGLPLEVFIEAIHPDDRQKVITNVNITIETGKDFDSEYRVIDINNEEHWVISRGRCIYNNKTPVNLTGSLIDITDKKRKDQEINKKTNELNNLFQELKFVTDTIPQLAWGVKKKCRK